jgi:hypothetical protein
MSREENINYINGILSNYTVNVLIENNDNVIYEYGNGIKDIVRTISKNSTTLEIFTEDNKMVGEYEKDFDDMSDNDIEYIARIIEDFETEIEKTLKRISN